VLSQRGSDKNSAAKQVVCTIKDDCMSKSWTSKLREPVGGNICEYDEVIAINKAD